MGEAIGYGKYRGLIEVLQGRGIVERFERLGRYRWRIWFADGPAGRDAERRVREWSRRD